MARAVTVYVGPPDVDGDPDDELELPGFNLVLNETFADGLNTDIWHVEVGTYGQPARVGRWHGDNVEVTAANSGGSGNSLKLWCSNNGTGDVDGGATSRWIGGMISSREAGVYYPRFGRYEIRARLHHGFGVWPAFWLRHRDGATICEVDIMEYFHGQVPGHTVGVLHRTNEAEVFQSNVNPSPRFTFFENVVAEGQQGWHTYACTFKPNASDPDDVDFAWEVDGEVFETHTDTSAQNWVQRYDAEAFDIALQGAQIGGNFTGHPNDPLGYSRGIEGCLIGGTPPNACTTTFSGQQIRRSELADVSAGGSAQTILGMEVDYVRVWEWAG